MFASNPATFYILAALALFGVVAVAVFVVEFLIPRLIRFRITERAVETRVFGLTVQRLPLREIEDPDAIRVTTGRALLRSGDAMRTGTVGKRGLVSRLRGRVVAIPLRGGHLYLVSPPDPEGFAAELRAFLRRRSDAVGLNPSTPR
jgi:hypothetical protein